MTSSIPINTGLRAGDCVFVRSKEEIFSTLDADGCLDGLLFQPEMLAFCGTQARVYKVAHKTCDTVTQTGGRRMYRTVHLDAVRCNGAQHGGCQADCLIFWKEAWLRRADASTVDPHLPIPTEDTIRRSEAALSEYTRVPGTESEPLPTWQCQATTLLRATEPLAWWDVRQYWRDVSSGNHSAAHIASLLLSAAFRRLIRSGYGYRAMVYGYDVIQKLRRARPYTTIIGQIDQGQKTPVENLDLRPGEWVEVKSLDAIQATLHWGTNHNRGMLFDKELLPYCGTRHPVRARIDRIIDERTGKMIMMQTPCIELEGAYCQALCSEKRIGCPRAIPSYWREIWLRRVDRPVSRL